MIAKQGIKPTDSPINLLSIISNLTLKLLLQRIYSRSPIWFPPDLLHNTVSSPNHTGNKQYRSAVFDKVCHPELIFKNTYHQLILLVK